MDSNPEEAEPSLLRLLKTIPEGEAHLCLEHILKIFNNNFFKASVKKIIIDDDFQWKVWSIEGICPIFLEMGFIDGASKNELIYQSEPDTLLKLLAKFKIAFEALDTKFVYMPRKAVLGIKKLSRAFMGLTGSCRFSVGFADSQGQRPTMEDEIVVYGMGPNLNPEQDYFAVFDGHGGQEASIFGASNLHKNFARTLRSKGSKATTDSEHIIYSLSQAFKDSNQVMCGTYDMNSGTCALVTFLSKNQLFVANLGDSRAVLGLKTGHLRITEDHKPGTQREIKRIHDIPGGFVTDGPIPRVQGVLSVSRALGDKKIQPYISPEPDIFWLELDPASCFLVLGCDGVWDKITDEEAVKLVREAKNPFEAATNILNAAVSRESKDNITVLVIYLADRKDWEVLDDYTNKVPHVTKILSA